MEFCIATTIAMEYDLIITNGVVVTDSETGDYDIAVKDEKIANIVPRGDLKNAKAQKTVDAEGGYVMVFDPMQTILRSKLSIT